MTKDKHIETAELQREIEDYIGLGQNSVVFEFDEEGSLTTLKVITINPRHRQSFLFKQTEGTSKIDALRNLLHYVKNYKSKEYSYTVQWSLKDKKELHTSYFSAKNIMEALDKFFYGRDPNGIVIFSVNLNPIA
jgi:hypothetical protein